LIEKRTKELYLFVSPRVPRQASHSGAPRQILYLWPRNVGC
jgi:hypothetical protein